MRNTAVLAAVLACCLTLTAFAAGLFSSLAGDELGLKAVYDGGGILSVAVENRSDKVLHFQHELKLMRWSTGETVEPGPGSVTFTNATIPARSREIMTIDLSQAYDLTTLEQPLEDDWYYIVLTNNNFVFGQDWMCSVAFAEAAAPPEASVPPLEADPIVVQGVAQELRPYFETVSLDIEARRALDAAYVESYTRLFAQFDGKIVPSVSPLLLVGDPAQGVILDDSIPDSQQYLLIGEHWSTRDAKLKLLATEEESALVLSAALPLQSGKDAITYLPLLYLFTYEKSDIAGEDNYAFLYGQIVSFAQLEEYKVYEDDRYVCYEVSGMIYSDLTEYARDFAGQNPEIHFDEQVRERVEKICAYYKENLGSLFYYK